jgi:phosphoglycolate phosphatase
MVGDRKHDIVAAHEHDIRAIGVLWGIGSEAELLTAGADAIAQTPVELKALLDARSAGPRKAAVAPHRQ